MQMSEASFPLVKSDLYFSSDLIPPEHSSLLSAWMLHKQKHVLVLGWAEVGVSRDWGVEDPGCAIPFPHFPDLVLALLQSLRRPHGGVWTNSHSSLLVPATQTLLNSSAQLFLVMCLFMLLAYVRLLYAMCVCLVSLGTQLSKIPSKSTWDHWNAKWREAPKQHDVQIQEAFTKVVFHKAFSHLIS